MAGLNHQVCGALDLASERVAQIALLSKYSNQNEKPDLGQESSGHNRDRKEHVARRERTHECLAYCEPPKCKSFKLENVSVPNADGARPPRGAGIRGGLKAKAAHRVNRCVGRVRRQRAEGLCRNGALQAVVQRKRGGPQAASTIKSVKRLAAHVNPPIVASKSRARLTSKAIGLAVSVIAIVSIGALTKRRSSYRASRSDRTAYNAGRGIRRPKSCSTIVTIVMCPAQFCPILHGDSGSAPRLLCQRWNNRCYRQYSCSCHCSKIHLISPSRRLNIGSTRSDGDCFDESCCSSITD